MGHLFENEPREPSRQEAKASLPEAAHHRSKKDRRRWCGGHVGREHVLEVRFRKDVIVSYRRARGELGCRWSPMYRWLRVDERMPEEGVIHHAWRGRYSVIDRYVWRCDHERGCVRCGKILDVSLGRADCPDFDEKTRPELPSSG